MNYLKLLLKCMSLNIKYNKVKIIEPPLKSITKSFMQLIWRCMWTTERQRHWKDGLEERRKWLG